jgi:hypothetical protein
MTLADFRGITAPVAAETAARSIDKVRLQDVRVLEGSARRFAKSDATL